LHGLWRRFWLSLACDVWMSSPVVGIRPLIPLVFAVPFLLIMELEEIIRELNAMGYDGPLSVEWEDSGMDREHGAREALEYCRSIDFPMSQVAFDNAMKD